MGRYTAREHEILRGVRADLRVFADGRPAFPALLQPLHELLRGDALVVFSLVLDPTGCRLSHLHAWNMPRSREFLAKGIDQWIGGSGPFAMYNPYRVEKFQRDRAICAGRLAQLLERGRDRDIDIGRLDFDEEERAQAMARMRAAGRFFSDAGVIDHDQLRVLVCDGPSMLAWVGTFNTGPIRPRQRQLLDAISGDLRTRLLLEDRLGACDLTSASLAVVLDAVPGAAYITTRAGQVKHANCEARRRLEADRARVVAALADCACGVAPPGYTAVPITSLGMGRHFLVVERPHRGDVSALVRQFARRHRASRRELEVLALLVTGASNKQIASALLCAERTVEDHVGRLLLATETRTRAELIARFWMQS